MRLPFPRLQMDSRVRRGGDIILGSRSNPRNFQATLPSPLGPSLRPLPGSSAIPLDSVLFSLASGWCGSIRGRLIRFRSKGSIFLSLLTFAVVFPFLYVFFLRWILDDMRRTLLLGSEECNNRIGSLSMGFFCLSYFQNFLFLGF